MLPFMKQKIFLAAIALAFTLTPSRAQTVETLVTGLFEPFGVAIDLVNNNYFFTDSANGAVFRFNPATNEPPTILTLATPDINPQGIVVARGGLVIVQTGLHRIDLVTFDGSITASIGG